MKKFLVLPIFLLISFSPMMALNKQVVEKEENTLSRIGQAAKETFTSLRVSLGDQLYNDLTPEEQEKYDINPMGDLRLVYTIITKKIPEIISEKLDEYLFSDPYKNL